MVPQGLPSSPTLTVLLNLTSTCASRPQSSFSGSVGMNLGVSVNVGTEAALGVSAPRHTDGYGIYFHIEILPEPFFDKSANFQLFQKTFPLFTVRRTPVQLSAFI